jgi:ATP-dependent DNA ligase
LYLRGRNILDQPLDERRELIRSQVMPLVSGKILMSESLEASAAEMVAAVKKHGLEGSNRQAPQQPL